MTKIALFSDIHGNYFALDAIINEIQSNNYDEVICLGDVVSIGVESRKCVERLLSEEISYVLGNHEAYFIQGADQFDEVSDGERRHQTWVASTMNDSIKKQLSNLPYSLERQLADKRVVFTHYSRKNNKFVYTREKRDVVQLDILFSELEADLVVYGHEHEKVLTHIHGKKEYVCVGSSGCDNSNSTYYIEMIVQGDKINFNKKVVEYDKDSFVSLLRETEFPDKKLITKAFFGLNLD